MLNFELLTGAFYRVRQTKRNWPLMHINMFLNNYFGRHLYMLCDVWLPVYLCFYPNSRPFCLVLRLDDNAV